VEATHGDLKFTAPLTGITAAVVGVIVNLALFFGWHVLWPEASAAAPFSGHFEWFYALLAVAAFIALWRFKQDILRVLAAVLSSARSTPASAERSRGARGIFASAARPSHMYPKRALRVMT